MKRLMPVVLPVVLLGLLSLLVVVPARAADGPLLKTGYYVALGDSVAAGEGALPVTVGYVYDLYDFGVFGRLTHMHFANIALRGARSWDLLDHQVPQVLCAEPSVRPTVVTITAGANDFFRGDFNIPAIAQRVAESIDRLLHNETVANPALDPISQQPCPSLNGVTILVSNYYAIPHPDPATAAQYDLALRGFDQALQFWLSFVSVPTGSQVVYVDLFAATTGRKGLLRGFDGSVPGVYNVHPNNLGHFVIAKTFADAWNDRNK